MIDAPDGKEFVFHDGTKAKNLPELAAVLGSLSDSEYSGFVNEQKNDFSSWIEYILMDKTFAERIRRVVSRSAAIQLINNRINESAVEDSIMKMTRREVESQKNLDATKRILMSELEHTGKKPEHHKEHKEHGERKGWLGLFAKSHSDDDLKKLEKAEEDKLRPEKDVRREVDADFKENVLWTVLYIVLIVVILALLAYKIFG